jgi:hypothetical protein
MYWRAGIVFVLRDLYCVNIICPTKSAFKSSWCMSMNLAFSTALSYTKRQGRHQSWDLGRAASCLLRLACEARRAVPAWHDKFFTRPKHGPWHGNTSSCCVGPSTPLAMWYFWPYENTIFLLWYEWWLTQFHTCKVDFVIYFYAISYIRL